LRDYLLFLETKIMDAATTKTFDAQVLNTVLPEVYATLTGFAGRDDFESVIQQVFGTTYDGGNGSAAAAVASRGF
jgi:hypothetical protein